MHPLVDNYRRLSYLVWTDLADHFEVVSNYEFIYGGNFVHHGTLTHQCKNNPPCIFLFLLPFSSFAWAGSDESPF